jgi:TRAP-type C4-dicarboxylate transport system permease large subunit
MGGAAKFLAQFFPLFLLGALFGKLMDDSGSVETIARFITDKLGTARAILAVSLAGAIVTYGGVSSSSPSSFSFPWRRTCSRLPTFLTVWCLRRLRSAP